MAASADMPLSDGAILGGGPWAKRMVALAAGLGMFLAALDVALNVALPSLTKDFDSDYQTVQWIIVVFIATRAGLVLTAGSFADRFGLRQVYIFGAATYLISMVCISLSPTLGMVVGFRVLQALGTGCLFAVSPAIAARLFPSSQRGLGMGLTTASQALGVLAGALGAGLLVEWFGCEAVFLGRIPFTVLALILGIWWLERSQRPSSRLPFDTVGAVTLFGTLLCLLIGLRLVRPAGWTSPVVVTLLLLAPLFLASFWWIERRAAWPILPWEFLRIRGVIVSVVTMALAHFGAFVIWFIFPFFVGDSLGRGAFGLGAMLAVMALVNTGFSAAGGWLCDRFGTIEVGLMGLAALSAGMLFMGFLDAQSSMGQVGLRIALVGGGLGLFQSSAYALMMGSVPVARFGTAAAALSLAQAVGTVLSVAVIGGIFAVSNDYHLEVLAGAELASAEMRDQAFVLAFRDVFWLGAVITTVSAGTLLMSRRGRAGPQGPPV